MSDNTQLNARQTEGDTIATDDIDGVKHQRVKIQQGADGEATDVSIAQGLSVEDNNSVLMKGLLLELKILNLHMSVMTDNFFTKQDVE